MNEVSRTLKLSLARKALFLAVTLAGAAATAEPTGPMAVHPLEVADAGGEESARLDKLFGPIVAAQPTRTIGPVAIRVLLKKRGAASCATAQEPARCLAELAQAAGGKAALLVTLAAYSGPRLILSGLVVRADGTTERTARREYPKGPGAALEASVKEALADFLESALGLGSPGLAPLVVPVEPPQAAVPEPAPVPGPQVAPGGMGRRLLPGLGLGLGAAVVGAAAVVGLNAASTGREWNDFAPNGAPLTAEQAEAALRVKQRLEAQQTTGVVLAVTGTALLAASAGGWLLAGDAPEPGASHAALLVYPGGVAVAGGF